MDGWTDRQKKWHTEVGTPPKNKKNPVYISGIDLTLWNTLNVLMPVTLIKRQWKKKNEEKMYQFTNSGTCATKNILKYYWA